MITLTSSRRYNKSSARNINSQYIQPANAIVCIFYTGTALPGGKTSICQEPHNCNTTICRNNSKWAFTFLFNVINFYKEIAIFQFSKNALLYWNTYIFDLEYIYLYYEIHMVSSSHIKEMFSCRYMHSDVSAASTTLHCVVRFQIIKHQNNPLGR